MVARRAHNAKVPGSSPGLGPHNILRNNMEPKSIEYKGIWVENEIELPKVPQSTPVDFKFHGKNVSDSTLLVRAIPSCGCTTTDRKEFKVEPEGEFTISGTYEGSPNTGPYSKRVHLWFGVHNTSDEHSKIAMTFRGEVGKV